jgi:hypothetical protein
MAAQEANFSKIISNWALVGLIRLHPAPSILIPRPLFLTWLAWLCLTQYVAELTLADFKLQVIPVPAHPA